MCYERTCLVECTCHMKNVLHSDGGKMSGISMAVNLKIVSSEIISKILQAVL